MTKAKNVGYWACTAIIVLVFAAGGLANTVHAASQVEIITGLGYPEYLLSLLGVAKLLAVVTLLVPGYPRLKEWAYAGLAIDMVGAAYSHVMVDGVAAAVPPLVITGVLFGSYFLRPTGRRLPDLV